MLYVEGTCNKVKNTDKEKMEINAEVIEELKFSLNDMLW